jgi:hypothetical protein
MHPEITQQLAAEYRRELAAQRRAAQRAHQARRSRETRAGRAARPAGRRPPLPRGSSVSEFRPPEHYEIRVEGILGERWTGWFEGLQVSTDGTESVISGPLADQAALHGVLGRIGDLGLRIISVRRDETGTIQ